MNNTPAFLRAWQRHIRCMLERTTQPSHAETVRPLRFDYELYGRYLQARNHQFNQTLTVLS